MWTGREERGVSLALLSSSIGRYTITAFKIAFHVLRRQGFWLFVVSWMLSVRGFVALPCHVLFFTTTRCRISKWECILQQKEYSAEPDEKSRILGTTVPPENHSAETQRWPWLPPVATADVFDACENREWRRWAERQGCNSSSTACCASLYWPWLMTILLLAEGGHQQPLTESVNTARVAEADTGALSRTYQQAAGCNSIHFRLRVQNNRYTLRCTN